MLVVLARGGFALGVGNTGKQVAAKDRWSESEAHQQCERQQASFCVSGLQLINSVSSGDFNHAPENNGETPCAETVPDAFKSGTCLTVNDLPRKWSTT